MVSKNNGYLIGLIALCVGLLIGGCARAPRLTFSGVSLPPDVKNFSVENFFNDASDGPADLGIRFSEAFRDYYQRNTPLSQISANGDLQFSGKISRYEVRPVAAGAGEFQQADLQRLTITVSVSYVNLYDQEKSFENTSFSFFQDFGADENLANVEDRLIEAIFDQILLDIFNKTVADW